MLDKTILHQQRQRDVMVLSSMSVDKDNFIPQFLFSKVGRCRSNKKDVLKVKFFCRQIRYCPYESFFVFGSSNLSTVT